MIAFREPRRVNGEALDSPLVKKLLSDEQETAIRHEIADYQNDPGTYIADLTRQQSATNAIQD